MRSQEGAPPVVLGPPAPFLGAALRALDGVRSPWVWLVHAGTVPRPGALAALLRATDVSPRALLLAGLVLDTDGGLHPDALPRHEIFEKQLTLDAAQGGIVHLRTIAHGSLLVAVEARERFAASGRPSSADGDVLRWSTRVLRSPEDPGYLVPDSVAVRAAAPLGPAARRARWVGRARLLAMRGGWTATERLWEAFVLGGEVVRPWADGRSHR